MTITPSLGTIVSDAPYLKDVNDKAAVIQGIVNVQNALKNVKGLTWQHPNPSTSAADYVNNVCSSPNLCHIQATNPSRWSSLTRTAGPTTGWEPTRLAATMAVWAALRSSTLTQESMALTTSLSSMPLSSRELRRRTRPATSSQRLSTPRRRSLLCQRTRRSLGTDNAEVFSGLSHSSAQHRSSALTRTTTTLSASERDY